jgi:hypothetical protein
VASVTSIASLSDAGLHWFERSEAEELEEIRVPGTWWLRSVQDPRWDCAERSVAVGGVDVLPECSARIEELRRDFGPPPDDLQWGYCIEERTLVISAR